MQEKEGDQDMRKQLFILKALIISVVILSTLLFPAVASATATTGTLISGIVTLNGNSLSPQDNAVVTASIPGVNSSWSKEVTFLYGESWYVQLLIPMDTGNGPRNGGVNGDLIHFVVAINGKTYIDNGTVTWMQGSQPRHSIDLTDEGSNLLITTDSLATGKTGVPYSQTLAATGGNLPYSWSWTADGAGLPPGLTLSDDGIISGTPTTDGTYPLIITVKDALNVPDTKNFTLTISNNASDLTIVTDELPRWVTEVWPANAPESWVKPSPGWIKGNSYLANLTASGGQGVYHWSATGLPSGLVLSDNGTISGIPDTASPIIPGYDSIVVTVHDSATPANSGTKTLKLKIYLRGDANGNGEVSIGDVAYTNAVILGLQPATAGCDADLDGEIDVADMTDIEFFIKFGYFS